MYNHKLHICIMVQTVWEVRLRYHISSNTDLTTLTVVFSVKLSHLPRMFLTNFKEQDKLGLTHYHTLNNRSKLYSKLHTERSEQGPLFEANVIYKFLFVT